MTAVTAQPTQRIITLDIVRGVAVMGILAMNIVAFAMPIQAYMNPAAYGMETNADFLSWLVSFIFIDGKMRGLFSLLFGAGILLVIERAEAKHESARSVHYRRMGWLLLFGLLHYYLIWWGDILSSYALTGMAAWFFRDRAPRSLIGWAASLLIAQFLMMALLASSFFAVSAAVAAPDASAEAVQQWGKMKGEFAIPSPQALRDILDLYRGSYAGIVRHQVGTGSGPLFGILLFGAETLAYMLFGMAGLKNGFLKGEWEPARYRRTAMIGFGIGIPTYALLAWALVATSYSIPVVVAVMLAATVIARPPMVAATAALIILLTRQGGAVVGRIAAAGRAAFTNYLATSILMTSLFYGYGGGLFGTLGRAELWLVVFGMWGLMLLWSKPWLDRYRYGPFEWLWRTLARAEWQPMRKPPARA